METDNNEPLSKSSMLMLEMKLLAANHSSQKNVKKAAQKRALVRRAIEDHADNKRLALETEQFLF